MHAFGERGVNAHGHGWTEKDQGNATTTSVQGPRRSRTEMLLSSGLGLII